MDNIVLCVNAFNDLVKNLDLETIRETLRRLNIVYGVQNG